ncbi:MAG: PA4642 family protein [Pseudomonadota bacterium]
MNAPVKKKDKAVITDEVWTDERIRLFLDVLPSDGVNVDFHRLLKAYQSMRSDDFKQFVDYFKEAGGDINAQNNQGKTLMEVIAPHKHSAPYLATLNA